MTFEIDLRREETVTSGERRTWTREGEDSFRVEKTLASGAIFAHLLAKERRRLLLGLDDFNFDDFDLADLFIIVSASASGGRGIHVRLGEVGQPEGCRDAAEHEDGVPSSTISIGGGLCGREEAAALCRPALMSWQHQHTTYYAHVSERTENAEERGGRRVRGSRQGFNLHGVHGGPL
jgi:hypothetical protein